jgi:S-adenosylmethionine hydrolase
MQLPRPCGIVTLLSDFGLADPWVGVMKGMIKREHRDAEVIDFCHGVPAHDVQIGAFYLAAALDRFPAGTVHVAVVDPGVGTARRFLAAAAAACFWIGPDNGILEPVVRRDDVEVRVIDLDKLRLQPRSTTFHGRDVFAPVAGMLCGGRFGFRALGERCLDPVRLPRDPFADDAEPRVIAVDRFGNLITNVTRARVQRSGWHGVRAAGRVLPLCSTYADVAVGEALAIVNSYDLLEVAVNCGSAAALLSLAAGARIEPVTQR